MENPAKKLKLREDPAALETPTIDPLVEIDEFYMQELILQHLKGFEVKQSMEVSPLWNEILSNSPKAMSNIKLVFYDLKHNEPPPKKVTQLLNSQRRYQNMYVEVGYKANAARKLLLIERFSLSLIELDVAITDLQEFVPKNLQFPKLKKLSLCNGVECLISENFSAPRLTSLHIRNNQALSKNMDEFLLRVSDSLTEFSLKSN
jgi:hypothetical protein